MEPIQNYTDYRAYLRDFYRDRKKLRRGYSYRTFCKAAGITSPSLYKEIAEGKRNLTDNYLPFFIKGMHLNDRDAKFFKALVKLGHAKSDRETLEQLEILRGLKPSVRQKMVRPGQFEYYSRWYNSVIREMACSMKWKGDYAALANAVSPRITKKEARESVELLLKLGFIRNNGDGSYSQADPAITTGSEVMSVVVRKLNEDLAGLGKEAIQKFPPTKRDISSIVIGASEESYGLIKREIKEFKQRICNIVDDNKVTDRVYSINVQLFPLSEVYEPEVQQKVETINGRVVEKKGAGL